MKRSNGSPSPVEVKKSRLVSIEKVEEEEEELCFQLLDLRYVPDDDHKFYFKGRTTDNKGIMGTMSGYQHFFYLERQLPFKNSTEVGDFLVEINRLVARCHKFQVLNPYGVQEDRAKTFSANTHWYSPFSILKKEKKKKKYDKNGGWDRGSSMAGFYTKFELIDNYHQTMAHYMPKDRFIQVVKVYVRHPYQAKVMHQFFESEAYTKHIMKETNGLSELQVRTFCASFPPELDAIINNDIKMGSWCTVRKYEELRGLDRIGYSHYNITCLFSDVHSDKSNIDPSNLRTLSFDGEMPGKNGRFPIPIIEDDPASTDATDTNPLDTDPVAILSAVIKETNVQSGIDFEQAVVFIYKHPDAEPTLLPTEWMETLKEKYGQDESLWSFDQVSVREFNSETAMLFAFMNFIHESDIDVLIGYNIDRFDLPYIYKRMLFHSKHGELKENLVPTAYGNPGLLAFDMEGEIKVFNLGCLRKGYSKMKQDYKSQKMGIISHRVNCDFYIMADGYNMWINDNMEKPTNYTLNVVAMENLMYSDTQVTTCYDRVKQKHKGVVGGGEQLGLFEKKILYSRLGYDDLISIAAKNVDDLERTLNSEREQEKDKEARAKMGFEMKKIDFDHAKGFTYWTTGGISMLHYALYCVIDSILPSAMIQKKSKLTANLLFSGMTGVGMLSIISAGQHKLVTSQVYALYKTHDSGIKLPYDRGCMHIHWPGVFDHPAGVAAGVRQNWERLKPYDRDCAQNQGGAVQELALHGVVDDITVTADAGSMYPTTLTAQKYSPCSFLNTHLIQKYDIPRHEYSVKYIGDSELNWCGEKVENPLEAAILGCENSQLKVTYWYQRMDPALGEMVKTSFADRNSGKKAKVIWITLLRHLNNLSEEDAEALNDLLDKIGGMTKVERATKGMATLEEYIKSCPKLGSEFSNVAKNKRMMDLLKTMIKKIMDVTSVRDLENLCLFQYENAENFQLAVKRTMNSLYGVLMMANSIFSCPEIAASITASGRLEIGTVRVTAERLTSTLSKEHMGYAGVMVKSNPDQVKPFLGDDGNGVYAGHLRFMQNETTSVMAAMLRSFEAFVSIYGDTDSVMCRSIKTSVVNKPQGFAVMDHLCIISNKTLPGMLKFNAEKIAVIAILIAQKIYDMKAFLSSDEDAPIKWIFSGADKSDTIPFVKELLSKCKQIILNGLDDGGRDLNEVMTHTCYTIDHALISFAMGRIPPAKLCMTKQLSKLTYAQKPPHHAQVAKKMQARGVQVNIKDYITYTFVKTNRPGSAAEPEDLNYIMASESPQDMLDLLQIWESCIENKIMGFLRNLIVPVSDYPSLDPMACKEVIKLQKKAEDVLKKAQNDYIKAGLFNRSDGIIKRLDKRSKEETKLKNYPSFISKIQKECKLCFQFYTMVPKKEEGGSRTHISLEYESPEGKTKENGVRDLCPTCVGSILQPGTMGDNKVAEIQEKYRKDAKELVNCWTKCLVCVELSESPLPGKISSCKATHCTNYKEKLELHSELLTTENILLNLVNFEGIDW